MGFTPAMSAIDILFTLFLGTFLGFVLCFGIAMLFDRTSFKNAWQWDTTWQNGFLGQPIGFTPGWDHQWGWTNPSTYIHRTDFSEPTLGPLRFDKSSSNQFERGLEKERLRRYFDNRSSSSVPCRPILAEEYQVFMQGHDVCRRFPGSQKLAKNGDDIWDKSDHLGRSSSPGHDTRSASQTVYDQSEWRNDNLGKDEDSLKYRFAERRTEEWNNQQKAEK